MFYPVQLDRDTNGTLLVSFPDLLWVHTFGDDEADALAHAADALETALEFLIRERRPIPVPSRGTGQGVALPALVGAKVALHNLMLAQGVTKADLRRRLHLHGPQVERLLDTKHSSRLDEVERAFGTFGRRLELSVRPEITAAGTSGEAQRRARKVTRKR